MVGNAPPSFLDLLEIATYVYCADQAMGLQEIVWVGRDLAACS
jgi:hypothetical protein